MCDPELQDERSARKDSAKPRVKITQEHAEDHLKMHDPLLYVAIT